MKISLILVLISLISADSDFLSDYEYGEMSYNNTRGISCSKCHGEYGQGLVIARYIVNKKSFDLNGTDIRKKSFDDIKRAVNAYHKVMPRYYLIDEEIQAIYDYLQIKNIAYLKSSIEFMDFK